jgi:hypothetical protein
MSLCYICKILLCKLILKLQKNIITNKINWLTQGRRDSDSVTFPDNIPCDIESHWHMGSTCQWLNVVSPTLTVRARPTAPHSSRLRPSSLVVAESARKPKSTSPPYLAAVPVDPDPTPPRPRHLTAGVPAAQPPHRIAHLQTVESPSRRSPLPNPESFSAALFIPEVPEP